ncbi:MAG: tRNA uridine-5-carboxymethylaminomethyl(34) synthesis GTPase MnmE [Endomicrobia bacterium]|nr:tRNA uridine-5-carboxymethylaminomethyl(34) synthesis GTPase MnmE [Endomicrobiia bacterium]
MNYISEDTIAALSTAAGQSALAVIRLSGGHSPDIIERIFKPMSQSRSVVIPANAGIHVKHGYIVDNGRKIDEVLCTFFPAPNTYTGENLVEISCHGNPVIIKEILDLLCKHGARLAGPGEFTYRAFLNGKMDLAEAEAVCALITSKTETAAKAALNNVSGEFSSKIKGIKDALTNLLAYLEASLDYPTDDIPFLTQQQKTERLEELIAGIQKLSDAYKISRRLRDGLKAVIIGKPNSGKSSLLNAILGRNRAIVTEIAGTTTDTIEEVIDCRGIPLTIIDTAGIRKHTENSIELLGQERTKEAAAKADLIIWVLDGSQPPDKNDEEIADFINKSKLDIPIIYVVNKIDLKQQSEEWGVKSEDKDNGKKKPVIPEGSNPESAVSSCRISTLHSPLFTLSLKLSAKTGKGIPELLDAVAKFAGISDAQNEILAVNSRHFTLLQTSSASLIKTKEAPADEIAVLEIKSALQALDEILGINAPADILDTIFSSFCIGK